jgi:hypothetical protein
MGRRLLLVGAVTVALVAGCATGEATTSAPSAGDGAALNAAADSYARLADVLNRLYDKCMAGKGFTVHPRHEPVDPAIYSAKEAPLDRPENLDQARKYGYGIGTALPAKGEDKAAPPDPFDELPAQVKQDYDQALTGPGKANRSERSVPGEKEREVWVMPDGNKQFIYKKGCQPETDRAVYGDVKRYVALRYAATSGLDRAVWTAASTEPAASAARAEWISCMAAKGYPGVTDSVDAARRADVYYRNVSRANPDAMRQAQDKETTQAVAHAECADQTDVNEKLTAAWHGALSKYLAEHEADLLAWQDFSEKALSRAQNMLAG